MYYRVWVASQRFHGTESLTYTSDEALEPGQIVRIPLQRAEPLGIIDRLTKKPAFSTKPIASSSKLIIPKESLQLLQWLYVYYPGPLGSLVELFTPSALGKKVEHQSENFTSVDTTKLPSLTDDQKTALSGVQSSTQSTLLHGVTGSGKTRIYLERAIEVIAAGESVMILTPEIGLTEQLVTNFSSVFGNRVLVTHSAMTPAQRRQVWITVSQSKEPVVIIGPRSALFLPVKNLGLIVMDEAHDTAYKQEQTPYYQTSRVAAQLARLHQAQFIMGTATPSIADYYTFVSKDLPIIPLDSPALKVRDQITPVIIDQRDNSLFNRSSFMATPLLKAIDTALENLEQSLLFLNRRGTARIVMCQNCGWQALCPHCDVPLTYHQDKHRMHCHSCDFSDEPPAICPECSAVDLVFKSIGTKALESEITRLYPGARVARFDRDTEKSQSLSAQYASLHSGEIDILIGTQSIAKGFDLPKLSVVGIIQADSGLQIPDYTAAERTFQLLSQVSGRVGRGHRAGKLFVQSYQPDSPLLAMALSKDYDSFYSQEIKQRELYNFPPFMFLLKITCSRASSASALKACQHVIDTIREHKLPVQLEGPSPRFIEKVAGKYAWHVIVKSPNRSLLLKTIKILPKNCTYDLDPNTLL